MNGVSVAKIAKIENVTTRTINRWIRDGKYDVSYTVGGHARIKIKCERRIGYVRVSSRKQYSSLQRQKQIIRDKYPGIEIISDIASGFNFNRKGLRYILEQGISGSSIEIICTTEERVARTGFNLIKTLIKLHGGEITTIEGRTTTADGFPVDDLIGFITSYVNSYHGKRSNLRKSNGDKKTTNKTKETKEME